MSKKRRREDRSDASSGFTAENPFAGLSGMREALAPGEQPPSGEQPPQAGEPAQQSHGRVVLRRQRKGHGGKTVVAVEGLRYDAELSKQIKNALGTGGRWEDDVLLVQGDQTDRLREFFERAGHRVVVG